jgi:dihydroflavonol-4-reductase
MNILLIGGQGFIGQYLARELAASPANKITIASRKIHSDHFIDLHSLPNTTLLHGVDITNNATIGKVVEGMDVVVNLAGMISFKRRDRKELININHHGALNVLKACEKAGVQKLIHLSSTAAMGYSNEIMDETFSFDWKGKENCVYSYSKYLANKTLLQSNIPVIVVYPPLVLGPGDKTNTLKLINAIKQGKIPKHPPGSNSLVDVRDLARAIAFLANASTAHKEFIISGGSYPFRQINETIAMATKVKSPLKVFSPIMKSPLQIAATLLELFSKNPPLTYENVFFSFRDRKHSSERLKGAGFNFEYSLEKTIEDSVKWVAAYLV